jgi:hypothetical protein
MFGIGSISSGSSSSSGSISISSSSGSITITKIIKFTVAVRNDTKKMGGHEEE